MGVPDEEVPGPMKAQSVSEPDAQTPGKWYTR